MTDLVETDRPIALLVNVLGSGGAQRRLATLANRFVELGRSVDVVSVYPGGPMTSLLLPKVRVVTLAAIGAAPLVSTAVHAAALARYLAGARPHALMSCVTDTHLLAVAAARLSRHRTPLVLRASRHPLRALPRRRVVKRLFEPLVLRKTAWCYARADGIVALTDDAALALRRLVGRSTPPIATIPNPVVAATLLDGGAPRPLPGDRMPLVLGIGRLVEQKDFGTMLRAFALLRSRRPVRLAILGEGPERARLKGLARELGVAEDVEMPGEVDDVPERLRHADALASSSLWEGLQATLVEALAAGCPVVATDCPGGARETLQDGRLGELVPVGDPLALADALERLLDDPADPLVLAAGAARFTPVGKAEHYLEFLGDLIECHGRGDQNAHVPRRAGSPAQAQAGE